MFSKKPQNKKYSIKQFLIAGLLVWLPIIVSIWVITYIIDATDNLINLLPYRYQPEQLFGFHIPGIGLIIALLVLLITGICTANVLGKKLIRIWDFLFGKIPVIKSIYFGVKKVSESILSESRDSFKDPILVQFPHTNSWTIGFITGSVPFSVSSKLKGKSNYISVYIPTTPNPTSGYVVFVKKSDTKAIDFTVDEALKYVISFGIMNKENLK